uniref:Uncharacterized protein n=1 Tax=Desulfobacca acetoxidans TaxID=60893 RepID=A0A7V4G9G8_9BACT
MTRILIVVGMLALLGLSLYPAPAQGPPLPPGARIVPPAAGVPPRLAQLSGVWEGAWEFDFPAGGGGKQLFAMDVLGREVKIAVLEISPSRINALCAMGGTPENPLRWFRVREASVAGDGIVLKWGMPGKQKTLTLRPTGNPTVAQATLDLENAPKPIKATLRKK